jgi:polynucleotide 5'-kinase involved in rRNA processing
MKSLSQTLLKIALLRFALFAVLVTLGAAAAAMAQNPRIQTSQLDALAAKASQTVDVNIDERLMQLAARFLSSKDGDEAKVKEIVNGLKGIYVKSFEFENEGQYTEADLEGIRSQLRNTAWNKIVNVKSKKEGTVEVYLMRNGNQISGLAVLATDPKEITVVNIIGPVDLDKLTQLEGEFGIPELEIERSKPKRKN